MNLQQSVTQNKISSQFSSLLCPYISDTNALQRTKVILLSSSLIAQGFIAPSRTPDPLPRYTKGVQSSHRPPWWIRAELSRGWYVRVLHFQTGDEMVINVNDFLFIFWGQLVSSWVNEHVWNSPRVEWASACPSELWFLDPLPLSHDLNPRFASGPSKTTSSSLWTFPKLSQPQTGPSEVLMVPPVWPSLSSQNHTDRECLPGVPTEPGCLTGSPALPALFRHADHRYQPQRCDRKSWLLPSFPESRCTSILKPVLGSPCPQLTDIPTPKPAHMTARIERAF